MPVQPLLDRRTELRGLLREKKTEPSSLPEIHHDFLHIFTGPEKTHHLYPDNISCGSRPRTPSFRKASCLGFWALTLLPGPTQHSYQNELVLKLIYSLHLVYYCKKLQTELIIIQLIEFIFHFLSLDPLSYHKTSTKWRGQ